MWWSDVRSCEVETGRAVEGFFRAAHGQAAGRDLVFLPAGTGQMEPEAPPAGSAAVARPYQRPDLATPRFALDVGEFAAVATTQVGRLRPVRAGVGA
jgi:hypothetical protein